MDQTKNKAESLSYLLYWLCQICSNQPKVKCLWTGMSMEMHGTINFSWRLLWIHIGSHFAAAKSLQSVWSCRLIFQINSYITHTKINCTLLLTFAIHRHTGRTKKSILTALVIVMVCALGSINERMHLLK